MFKIKGDTKKLVKGISFSLLRFVLVIGIGLIQTPILFKNLSSNELNFWYIFYSFGAFFQMADLGLIQTISRLVAYRDSSSKESVSEESLLESLTIFKTKQIYVTALFSFFFILIVVGLIINVSFAYLHASKVSSDTLSLAFLLYTLGIIFSLLSNIPGAMLIGYRDVGAESLIKSISQVIYFIIILVFLPTYKSIVFVSIAFFIQNFGQLIALHLTFILRHKSVQKEVVPLKELFKASISKSIYKQSTPLAINQLGGWLISQGNIFIASIIVGSGQISDYAINQQVFTYIASIALVINQTLAPFIAKQYIQDRREPLKQLFIGTVISCLSIVSLLLIIQMTCGYEIIGLWVGEKHYLGLTFSAIFALITFLEVQHSVGGNFVWNTGSWPFNTWTLAAGLLNITIGYILGKHYGLLGMAFATLVSKLVTLNWYVIYYCLRRLVISARIYVLKVLVPLLSILGFVLSLGLYMKTFFVAANFSPIIIVLTISVVSFILLALTTVVVFRSNLLTLYKEFVLKAQGKSVENVL